MKESIDKSKAIIHCDGPTPSRQKSGERFRRQEYLAKKLQELSLQVDKISINKRSLTAVYNKCKSLYRAPETAISEILDELSNLDWKVCRCGYQADSHIAELCRDDQDAVIITKDSDFIVYENTESVIMPVGRGRELTRFDKADVMTALKLPSARHLLLASILSKNDYSSPVPWFGIHKNAEVVRELEIDQYSSNFQLVGIMKEAIRKYLAQINKLDSKTPHDYRHAITAFVECREDTSDDAVPSRSTHDGIVELLRKIEEAKVARRQPASSVSDPVSPSEPVPSSSTGPASSSEPAPSHPESIDSESGEDEQTPTGSTQRKRRRRRSKRRSQKTLATDPVSPSEPVASSSTGPASLPDPTSLTDPGPSRPDHNNEQGNKDESGRTTTGRTQRKRRRRRRRRRKTQKIADWKQSR